MPDSRWIVRREMIFMFKKIFTLLLIFTLAVTNISIVNAKKIKISKKSLKLEVGTKEKLSVRSSGRIKWKSSNKKVAVVNKKGVVKAKKPGKANITACKGKLKAVCKVRVISAEAKKTYVMSEDFGSTSEPQKTYASDIPAASPTPSPRPAIVEESPTEKPKVAVEVYSGTLDIYMSEAYLGDNPEELFPEVEIESITDFYKFCYENSLEDKGTNEDVLNDYKSKIGTYFIVEVKNGKNKDMFAISQLILKNEKVKKVDIGKTTIYVPIDEAPVYPAGYKKISVLSLAIISQNDSTFLHLIN